MMTVPMDKSSAPSSRELAQRLYKKNIELENGLRKSAQSKVPSDPNAWLQMRENYEAIILEDHEFSEKHEVEYILWQLHYRRIEEFRAHINAAAASGSVTSQGGKNVGRPDRIKKIRAVFKSFLSEATGFYHDLIQKIRSKYGLPLSYFSEGPENHIIPAKDEKRSAEMKKGLMSCHRCLIYLGDLARYKGLYGEGDSVSRDYVAAASYYIQAASLYPSSGNPHHQLAILASYSGDELVAIYRYFRSLAVDSPFSTARDNLIIAFEKNRQSYSQLPGNTKVASARTLPARSAGRGRGRGDARLLTKDTKTESAPAKERDLSVPEVFKAFSTRFVRFNGILFTRTSLETFGEIFSLVISDLQELLSPGTEEELNFAPNAAENALVIVRLIAILIFSVHNVNRESEGQSYAEILQRTVLLQNAFAAAFEFAGYILQRCMQLHDVASSYLLPAIMVFIEWLACHPDIAAGFDVEEKQAGARSFFWNQCVSFMNKLSLTGLVSVDGDEDESCFFDMSRYDEGETGNRLALWEDFELRGFLPLVPAQLILDFSRKHTFGIDGSTREKKARVQRILAAGRALMNVVQVDEQRIYYDPQQKKFVIGAEPPAFEGHVRTGFLNAPQSNLNIPGNQVAGMADLEMTQTSAANFAVTQAEARLYGEGDEEEEEEIVFKPTVVEKYPSVIASKPTAYEINQAAPISSAGDWTTCGPQRSAPLDIVKMSTVLNASLQLQTTAPNNSHLPSQYFDSGTSKWLMEREALLSDELKNMNINSNGFLAKPRLQDNLTPLQPTAFSPLFSMPADLNSTSMLSNQIKAAEVASNLNTTSMLSNQIKAAEIATNLNAISMLSSQTIAAEVAVPSAFDSVVPSGPASNGLSAALTTQSRKIPVSRPVRHFGPPPGFNHVPFKQPDDSISNSVVRDQLPQIDDYSWLDGYQSSSSNRMGMENTTKHLTHMCTNVTNAFKSPTSFPFPGKQISSSQTQVVDENKWQDFQLFEHLKPYSDQQLQQANPQHALLPEQHQGQSLWSGRYFV